MSRSSIFGGVTAFGTVVLTLTVLYVIYLAFFDLREPPIKINYSHPVALRFADHSAQVENETSKFFAGDVFYTYRDWCVTSDYTTVRTERWLIAVDRSMHDVALPLLPSRVKPKIGCNTRYFLNQIPEGTPPGGYAYRLEWVYLINGNPITVFRWSWPDVMLKVAVK